MILRVTQYDEAILRRPGITVENFDEQLGLLAKDMIETMREEEGIGLAAHQVGRAIRMFVMDIRPAASEGAPPCVLDGRKLPLDIVMPMILVNPEIETYGEELTWEEGCLSLPEIRGDVTRPSHARVSFQDLEGHPHLLECDGLLARCAQHEHDHINGVLFIDSNRMSSPERKRLAAAVKTLREKTRHRLGQGTD